MWTPEGKRLWAGECNKTPRVPEEAGMKRLWKLKLNVYRGIGKKEQVEVQGTQTQKRPERYTAFMLGSLTKVVFHHTEPVHKD